MSTYQHNIMWASTNIIYYGYGPDCCLLRNEFGAQNVNVPLVQTFDKHSQKWVLRKNSRSHMPINVYINTKMNVLKFFPHQDIFHTYNVARDYRWLIHPTKIGEYQSNHKDSYFWAYDILQKISFFFFGIINNIKVVL